MKKIIVTTTINEPTEAIHKFSKKKDWTLIVVGDLKTPHEKYIRKVDCIYLHPGDQEKKYKELSGLIGWNTIQRRNIGFLEAYHLGADIIASVDDDNIPYDGWGTNLGWPNWLHVGNTIECDLYKPVVGVFDPLSVTNMDSVWHRGYPVQYLDARHLNSYRGKVKRKVLIQADLWDGDPDIDAIARIGQWPTAKFDISNPYCSDTISPFNSQNTFFAREVIPYYAVLPFVGRMDDVWGGYMLQKEFPNSLIYCKASVYQKRNTQDLIKNLEDEIIGYRHTKHFIESGMDLKEEYIQQRTRDFYKLYTSLFKGK